MVPEMLRLTAVDLDTLSDLVDSRDFGAGYLDPATGEVVVAFDGEVLGEDGEPVDLDDTDWIAVGGASSGPAYHDMEAFAQAVPDGRLRELMERALAGRGAFRRFKDVVHSEPDDLARIWYRYRDLRAQARAIAWLADNGLVDDAEADAEIAERETSAEHELAGLRGPRTAGARLVLLNGMPGIGKSTLAARYVAEHPGVLDLDVDRVRGMIGGDVRDTAEPARVLALAMAQAHLRSGQDVVVPQLVARIDQVVRFEEAAREAGASFVHVLLVDAGGDPVARFRRRGGEDARHDAVRSDVADHGGDDTLRGYADALDRTRAGRPEVRIVRSVEGDPDGTWAALREALAWS